MKPAARSVVLTALACMVFTSANAEDERLSRLPADQQDLAKRMTAFLERMDDKYFARVEALNGSLEFEDLIMSTDNSDYDIRVTRGPVVEKTGRMLSMGKKQDASRGDGVLVWGRFYSLDIHPKTPLVGMLHATIVLQFFEDETMGVGGWLDVMPATRIDEDIEALRALTDGYFAERDADPALYHELMCKGTEDTVFEFRRKPSCAGVSFYGPPVFRQDPAKSYVFVEGLFDLFVDKYLDIVADRADDPYTEADLAAQDEMRKRWLIDQLYSDPYASSIVPYQVWWHANVPPVVKF